jgi:hypothetical protein
MTLEDLDQTLPNGLHDARIRRIDHDFEQATVKFYVEILVGLPADPPAERSRYRRGVIAFNRVLFCWTECPENERILGHNGSIWFTYGRTEIGVLPAKIANAVAADTLCYSLYVLDWLSHIHIAAGDVSFLWQ